MIATAYLRVYVPSIEVAGLPPHRSINRVGRVVVDDEFMWSEPIADDAIFTVWNGTQYACPRNPRVRMLEGVVALGRHDPDSYLVSDREQVRALAELSRLRRTGPIGRSHILSSAFHVPLRWFCAFHASERELYEANDIESIRYRTSIGDAIDRVRWAASVLEGAGFPAGPIEHLTDLDGWLAGFSADSMLELDYGRVATVFATGELVFDESAGDIRDSLLALERGDFPASGEGYQRVARRWASPQASTFTN
ncbi:MAG: hypothetical protein R2823_01665 [Acidimicrobiia bacterium]